MTCEKCGLVLPDDALRTHDGQWLCHLHKALAASGPLPKVPEGMDVAAAIESVASRFAAFTSSQDESFRSHERSVGEAIARTRAEAATRHAQIDTHESRLAAAEASLGTARDILGDVSTRGDVSAQIGKLAAEIAALKAKHAAMDEAIESGIDTRDSLDERLGAVEQFMFSLGHKTFWQRLMWLLFGR